MRPTLRRQLQWFNARTRSELRGQREITPAALNARTAALTISSNAGGSPHGVALSGSGVAAPAAAITLNPTSLAYGNQTVGTVSAAKVITLTNSGNAALGISSIATTGAGFAATHNCSASLAASAPARSMSRLHPPARTPPPER